MLDAKYCMSTCKPTFACTMLSRFSRLRPDNHYGFREHARALKCVSMYCELLNIIRANDLQYMEAIHFLMPYGF